MAPQRVDSRDFEQLAEEEDGHPQNPPAPRTSESGAAASAAARAQRNKWLAAAVIGWAVLLIFVRALVLVLLRCARVVTLSCAQAAARNVGSAAAAPPSARMPPLPADAATMRFLVFGDWGRQGQSNQAEVAASMGAVAEQLGVSFAVSTGDNVYERGITSADDPLFKRTFTDVYTHPALAELPFYSVMGNHDWLSNVSAQVSPLGVRAGDARWTAHMSWANSASAARTLHWLGVDEGSAPANASRTPLLSLVYIDTSPWVQEYRGSPGLMNWPAAGIVPPSPSAAAWQTWEDAQAARLTAALASSNARWKMVVGHHPVYSYGGHNSQAELQRLNAIMRSAGVVAYLNGHDHDLQCVPLRCRHRFSACLRVLTCMRIPSILRLQAHPQAGWFGGRSCAAVPHVRRRQRDARRRGGPQRRHPALFVRQRGLHGRRAGLGHHAGALLR
jgi:hypothetical protein